MRHDGQAMLSTPSPRRGDDLLRVLLIEDDPGDAFLVRELLAEADANLELVTVTSVRGALETLRDTTVHCVLLDLGLPDATGLSGLRQLRRAAAAVALCVLTGLDDEHLGIAALSEGAQDYLAKGRVDGGTLSRAVRYAVERRRAEASAVALREAELRQAESARLERGLLPQPLLGDVAATLVPFYQPGRHRALLGGDFIDAIQTGPDQVHLIVGDVAGHGVEAAALGVSLRVAWRALILAQVDDDDVLPSLQRVLETERRYEEQFATVVMATVSVGRGLARVRVAGHPPPLVLRGDEVRLCPVHPGIVLGAVDDSRYEATEVALGDGDWSLLLYTDGLIEGYVQPPPERLGLEGLQALLHQRDSQATPLADVPRWLVAEATQRNGGPLADDVAILLLSPE